MTKLYPPGDYRRLAEALSALGLAARGGFPLESAEGVPGPGVAPARALVLVGAVGDGHWPAFEGSPERADGRPDPLDRWSRRLLEPLAADWRARALFPFEGPPFWPFQRWAARAEPVHASPVGPLIHPRYGLWHSYRGALAFAEPPAGLPAARDGREPLCGLRGAALPFGLSGRGLFRGGAGRAGCAGELRHGALRHGALRRAPRGRGGRGLPGGRLLGAGGLPGRRGIPISTGGGAFPPRRLRRRARASADGAAERNRERRLRTG